MSQKVSVTYVSAALSLDRIARGETVSINDDRIIIARSYKTAEVTRAALVDMIISLPEFMECVASGSETMGNIEAFEAVLPILIPDILAKYDYLVYDDDSDKAETKKEGDTSIIYRLNAVTTKEDDETIYSAILDVARRAIGDDEEMLPLIDAIEDVCIIATINRS